MTYFSVVLFSITIIFFLLLNFCKKKNFLLNYRGNIHQKFTNFKNIPLLGGVIILILSIFFLKISFSFKLFILLIFLIGFFSDLNYLVSPKIKFCFLFFIIFITCYYFDLTIADTRISFVNLILNNKLFSLVFSTFCILIITNGSNFIDGNNTNLIGYYLIVSIILLILGDNTLIYLDKLNIILITEVLLFLYIFNLFNKIYMGDSGSFLLGFFYSVFLIKFHNLNTMVSPYFIILLLWYPGFENLFSIIRKLIFSMSPTEPDNYHLHHLIFYYLIKNFHLTKKYLNSLTGIIISLYNFIILFFSLNYFQNTKFILALLLINILIYVLLYLKLFQFRKKN